MNISELFTKNNIRILKLIAKERLHVRDIAEKLDISPATVHNFAKKLKEEGLLKEEKDKNRIILRLNNNHPLIKQARTILNYQDFIKTKTYKKLKKIGEMGIYGSYAEGTDDAQSDLDLWMKTDKKELELRPLIRELEEELRTKVSLLVLTKEKIKSIEKNDSEFFMRLKLTSVGDELD